MTKATALHKSFFTPINSSKKCDLHCVLSKTKLDFCLFTGNEISVFVVFGSIQLRKLGFQKSTHFSNVHIFPNLPKKLRLLQR